MGADGGIVGIPLKNSTQEHYARVLELLKPFWQFLSMNSGASWAEDANYKWEEENASLYSDHLIGYYGTDRCDNFELGDLPVICEPFVDYRGDLYSLTFDELDMDCRTSYIPIKGDYHDHPLHRLWYQHFGWTNREETLTSLGPIASMTCKQWAEELDSLLQLNAVWHEETWT